MQHHLLTSKPIGSQSRDLWTTLHCRGESANIPQQRYAFLAMYNFLSKAETHLHSHFQALAFAVLFVKMNRRICLWLWPLFHILLSEHAFLLVSIKGYFHKTDELGDPFVTIMPGCLNCGHTDFEQSYHGLQEVSVF